MKTLIKQAILICMSALLLTSCSSTQEIELQGAGATFHYPLYSEKDYRSL